MKFWIPILDLQTKLSQLDNLSEDLRLIDNSRIVILKIKATLSLVFVI
jgi:hypothetical protein